MFVYNFVLDRPQCALTKLYNIRALLNRANCWNFQIDEKSWHSRQCLVKPFVLLRPFDYFCYGQSGSPLIT